MRGTLLRRMAWTPGALGTDVSDGMCAERRRTANSDAKEASAPTTARGDTEKRGRGGSPKAVYAASDAGAAIDRDSGNRIGRACAIDTHCADVDLVVGLRNLFSGIGLLREGQLETGLL